ncbi:MAG: phosphodiester glycosidase family protein [Verrucomicrobia bacterium]|nr:phosphodiester glycosidase family protein [Verrucomicrobiota bacterium]
MNRVHVRSRKVLFDWVDAGSWHPSIQHVHYTTSSPRTLSMHVVRIDLSDPAIRFTTTGRAPDWVADTRETLRERTVDFITRMQDSDRKVVLAINGNWYGPTGQSGGPVNLNGLAISDGILVSPPWSSNQHAFVIREDLSPDIVANSAAMSLEGITQAVSGYVRLLNNGNASGQNTELNARTVIGFSADKRFVIMLVIDGRRPGHSEGATDFESALWLRYFGAWNGINLDGGGSSTMARWNASTQRAEVLNIPTVQFLGVPITQQRFVGNHLGVYLMEDEQEADTYAAWVNRQQLKDEQADPLFDISGDGWVNLFAYAFNFNPFEPIYNAPGFAIPDAQFLWVEGVLFYQVDFRKNAEASDLSISLEFSTDPGSDGWVPIEPTSIENLEPDPITGDPRWRFRKALSDLPFHLFRLRITLDH